MNRRNFIRDAGAVFFVGCGLVESAVALPQSQSSERRRAVTVGGRRVRTIDMHCHCYVPEAWDLVKNHEQQNPLNLPTGPALNMTNLDSRLAQMDQQGIDVQAISINPFWYWADRDLAGRIIKL